MREYKRGNYQKAFDLLKEPASFGYKGSQYVLAFMFLKGQYVQQSTLLGMGWLGVAVEANVKEWREQYNTFYSGATPAQQEQIDKTVRKYIQVLEALYIIKLIPAYSNNQLKRVIKKRKR